VTIHLDQALLAIREPQAGDIGERIDMLSEERRRREFEAPQDPNAMVEKVLGTGVLSLREAEFASRRQHGA
jgi:hypothetical protein